MPKVERGGQAARLIHNPEDGERAGEGGQADARQVGGGTAGARDGGRLSSSKDKQTVPPLLPGSRSPGGKLFPLLHQTLHGALLPPGEAAAREGLSQPVPADSQLIGP